MTNAPKYLQNHKNFSQNDYNHLTRKGYTNREIQTIWDRDRKNGNGPVTVDTDKVDYPTLRTIREQRKIKSDRLHAEMLATRDQSLRNIEAKIGELTDLIKKHHGGDYANWSDIGSLEHILNALTNLTKAYDPEA